MNIINTERPITDTLAIRTDFVLFNIIRNSDLDITLVNFCFTTYLNDNMNNIKLTQDRIDRFIDGYIGSTKMVFLCQHDYVSELNWHGHICISGSFINTDILTNINISMFPIRDLDSEIMNTYKYDFSFMGMNSHTTREILCNTYDNCTITRDWGSDMRNSDYVDYIYHSKVTLCPRGFGVSSIRLYEVLSARRVPIIISDDYCLPFSDIIDWDTFSIIVCENDILNIHNIVNTYSREDIDMMAAIGYDVYTRILSEEAISNNIIYMINDVI